jgi:hypothetical protein
MNLQRTSRRLKTLSESFDQAQDERRLFDIIEVFPSMLRLSKHSELFFSNLLVDHFGNIVVDVAPVGVGTVVTLDHLLAFVSTVRLHRP